MVSTVNVISWFASLYVHLAWVPQVLSKLQLLGKLPWQGPPVGVAGWSVTFNLFSFKLFMLSSFYRNMISLPFPGPHRSVVLNAIIDLSTLQDLLCAVHTLNNHSDLHFPGITAHHAWIAFLLFAQLTKESSSGDASLSPVTVILELVPSVEVFLLGCTDLKSGAWHMYLLPVFLATGPDHMHWRLSECVVWPFSS